MVYCSHMNEVTGCNISDTDDFRLFELLLQSEKLAETRLEQALKKVKLTKAKVEALRQLVLAGEPLPLGQLAERLHCVKSNATQLADRLETEGLVRRVFASDDRRTVLAEVTEEGQQRYYAGMQVLQDVIQALSGHYSPEERKQFIEFLTRLRELWTE